MRHHEVYFHVRKDLIPHMVNSMQRLGLNSNVSIFSGPNISEIDCR